MIKHCGGIKTIALKTGCNQMNQIQFEKLGGNNKVGNYNPAKVGNFMLALTRHAFSQPARIVGHSRLEVERHTMCEFKISLDIGYRILLYMAEK